MDLVKIGKFIKECRKEKNCTQQELADKLSVSFKTISKWECGKGFPDVSLLLPLCNELEISVNELLNGCHIQKEEYIKMAEEKLVESVVEAKINKKRLISTYIIGIISIVSILCIFLLAAYVAMDEWLKTLILVVGMILLITSCLALCVIDNGIGYFECKHCKERFVPSMKAYIFAPHSLTTRFLKCPKCGKTSNCKKRLSSK